MSTVFAGNFKLMSNNTDKIIKGRRICMEVKPNESKGGFLYHYSEFIFGGLVLLWSIGGMTFINHFYR